MICDRCRKALFAEEHWAALAKGFGVDVLSSAITLPIELSCTICSSILQDVTNALAARAVEKWEPVKGDSAYWKQVIKEWPVLPVKAEKRIGRYSLIIGPCHRANVIFTDGWIETLSLDSRLFILSPRTDRADLYPTDDDDFDRSSLGNSTSSIQSMQQVNKWLTECNSGFGHSECAGLVDRQHSRSRKDGGNAFVPTRLIDVGEIDDPTAYVVITEDHGIKGPYMTLSHMWGIPMGERFMLTSLNKSQYCDRDRGIRMDDEKLPNTFKQAIEVTRKLGIRYLWIDSICIVQGDDDDFKREGAKMEAIYRDSYCNLAAVNSKNGTFGLYRTRDPNGLPPDIVVFKHRQYALVRPDFWDHQLLNEPLYARGWVLQERILTGRILHFAKEQIFWQCPSLTACESSPSRLPIGIQTEEAKLELTFRRALHQRREKEMKDAVKNAVWKHVVRGYSSCNLSFDGDKFIALHGTATAFERALGEKFIAGLWDAKDPEDRKDANIPDQLGWMVKDGLNADRQYSLRYKNYRAPSWSWACLDAIIVLKDRINRDDQLVFAKITHVTVNLQDPLNAPLGAVRRESTCMKVRGRVTSMKFVQRGEKWNEYISSGQPDDERFESSAYLDTFEDVKKWLKAQDNMAYRTADVLLLEFHRVIESGTCSGHGLLIWEAEHGMDIDESCYSRFGVVYFEGLSDDQYEQVKAAGTEREIVLV